MKRVALTKRGEAGSGGLSTSCIKGLARARWWRRNREGGIQPDRGSAGLQGLAQHTVQAAQLKTPCDPRGRAVGAGGGREKPEQGETTFYILVGYKNVSSFYRTGETRSRWH